MQDGGWCGRSRPTLDSQPASRLGVSQSAWVWVAKRSRNDRLIAESMRGEQAYRGGEHDLQVRTELVGGRDPVLDQVAAGPDGGAQRGGRGGVAGQRASRRRSVRTTSAST